MATKSYGNNLVEDVLDAALDDLLNEDSNNDGFTLNVHDKQTYNSALASDGRRPIAAYDSQQLQGEVLVHHEKSDEPPHQIQTSRTSLEPDHHNSSNDPLIPSEEMEKLGQMITQLLQIHRLEGESEFADGTALTDRDTSRRMFEEMEQFMAKFESERDDKSITMPSLSNGVPSSVPTSRKPSKQPDNRESCQNPSFSPEKDVSKVVSHLLDDMAKTSVDNNSNDSIPDHISQDQEFILQGMVKELEGLVNGLDADQVIDGMMEHLVSKDIMYEPLQQVTSKFPKWLTDHKEKLTENEYQDRCRQYECFRRIVNVYETDPDNHKKLMSLMQEVQEFGQPPCEIIQEIAPGFELDEEGVPKMIGPAGPNEECNVM